MNLNLKNKYALVTGGSHGIGRAIAIALQPFMPEASQKMLVALGFEYFDPKFDVLQEWGLLKSGTQLSEPQPLFPHLQ